jgi:carbonic anhydrase/acetyltransferase-like protein (isoleucine patch superfamily)
MDYAVVKSYAMVAAGALVPAAKIIEENEIWAGIPAKFMRTLTEEEKNYIIISKNRYVQLGNEHANLLYTNHIE